MVAATAVDVAAIDDIPAGNLQVVLGSIYGKAQYAASAAGTAQGQAQYAADQAGFLDYHLRQIAALVGYTMPSPVALAAEEPVEAPVE